MSVFEFETIERTLSELGAGEWAEDLRSKIAQRCSTEQHGTLGTWMEAWESLPKDANASIRVADGIVTAYSDGEAIGREITDSKLRQLLMQFHPWRKGPFEILGVHIDTEWRSNLKWDRFKDAVDFQGKKVLDVGCGNGYYGWRMVDAGAELVLGCEPFLLYVMQFEVLRKYAARPERHFIVPIGDTEIPDGLQLFDITCSMGVLYHRTSPIDHLKKLHSTLRAGGTLLFESLVLEDPTATTLTPEDRYAKMRNVWFIPSIPMMETWLRRTGFREIQLIDVTPTTCDEQRRTDWMTFESHEDFLDPSDASKTIEGYPSPVRAIWTATK